MNNSQDIRDELLHLELLWRQYNQRLHVLELREAAQGINADPATTIEMRQLTQRMQDTEKRYLALSKLL